MQFVVYFSCTFQMQFIQTFLFCHMWKVTSVVSVMTCREQKLVDEAAC
jgi:hypothetical protein